MKKQLGLKTSLLFLFATAALWVGCSHNWSRGSVGDDAYQTVDANQSAPYADQGYADQGGPMQGTRTKAVLCKATRTTAVPCKAMRTMAVPCKAMRTMAVLCLRMQEPLHLAMAPGMLTVARL